MLDFCPAYRYNISGTVDDMILDLSKIKLIPQGRADFHFAEPLDPAAYDFGEYALSEPVICQGQASNQESYFAVEGQYRTVAQLVCSRCNQPYSAPVEGEFSVHFVKDGAEDWDGEQDVYELQGDQADLGAVTEA